MKKSLLLLKLVLLTIVQSVCAQNNSAPYDVTTSKPFETPDGFAVENPIILDNGKIIQVSAKKVESFLFQRFSKQLVFEEEKLVNTNLVQENSRFERAVRLKNKTHVFVRQIGKAKEEAISALEFSPEKLDFVGGLQPLFQTSGRLKTYFREYEPINYAASTLETYHFETSKDSSKFLYAYSEMTNDKNEEGKQLVGMHVYNENLKKQGGGEFEIPRFMNAMEYTLGNDGKVYMLAMVYDDKTKGERKKNEKENSAYHFELLIYDKDTKEPKIVQLNTDNYFPSQASVDQDEKGNILVIGFYSKDVKKRNVTHGLFMIKLAPANNTLTKVNSGFYEISTELIMQHLFENQKEKLREQFQGGEIGLLNLRLRKIYTMPGGGIKVISEVYLQFFEGSIALDAYVLSIDKEGKMDWIKSIHKIQISGSMVSEVSFNSYMDGEDLNMFYLENPKNVEHPEKEPQSIDGVKRRIKALRIDKNGKEFYYSLKDINDTEATFCIRYLINGGHQNLVNTQRKNKKNTLFSIQSKKV